MKKDGWFSPLANRIKTTSYTPDNPVLWVVSIISPLLVYWFLGQFVTLGCAYIIGTGQYGTTASDFFVNHSLLAATIIRISAVTLAVVPLIYPFIKENPVYVPDKRLNSVYMVVVVALAMVASLFFNSLAMISGFTKSSQDFSQTASAQFSLPIWLGLIIYGIVTPVTEEVVHRGLVYNRLRKYLNVPISMIFGAFLFGFSHGNLVQLIYGFVMGLIICYIYERLGAFVYPVVFHCVANATVYVCMSILPIRNLVISIPAIAVEGVGIIGCMIVLLKAKNIDTKMAE